MSPTTTSTLSNTNNSQKTSVTVSSDVKNTASVVSNTDKSSIDTSSTNKAYTKQTSANNNINTSSQKTSNIKSNTESTASSSYSNNAYKPSSSYSSNSYKTSSSYSSSSYKQSPSYPSSKITTQEQAIATSKASGYAITTRASSTHNNILKKPTTTVSSNIKTTTIGNNGKPIYISHVSRTLNCNAANSTANNGVPKQIYDKLEDLKYSNSSKNSIPVITSQQDAQKYLEQLNKIPTTQTSSNQTSLQNKTTLSNDVKNTISSNNGVPKHIYDKSEELKYGNNTTTNIDEKSHQ